MCLAVPARITEVNGTKVTVDVAGYIQQASIRMMPDAKVGEYVIIHAGYAIEKLDEEQAKETIALFMEMEALGAQN